MEHIQTHATTANLFDLKEMQYVVAILRSSTEPLFLEVINMFRDNLC
jgi:hypothetical protein